LGAAALARILIASTLQAKFRSQLLLGAALAIGIFTNPALAQNLKGHPVSADVLKDLAPTGTLRAAMNFGNGVLVQRGANDQEPKGVAPDLARELGRRLNVPVTFVGFDGAGQVFDALKVPSGDPRAWDIAFLAIEPVRAAEIAFTAPYVLIEGTYMVLKDSPLKTVGDVDRPGHRISVGPKSAYDLFLTRTLKHAELVRADVGGGEAMVQLFLKHNLDAAAGVRQPLEAYAKIDPNVRVMSDRFMEIRQAMGTHQGRDAGAAYIKAFVEEMKASGFVADALARSGQKATVAPAEK
jgi:polar amino acid transport system substrate-binding protein